MNRFFHFWLTCPSCHEPHLDSLLTKPFFKENGLIRCTNKGCRIAFSPILRLSDPEYYKIPKEIATKGIPLFWEIIPNPIEQEYIDLFTQSYTSNDLILITWPWDKVKCIPLIVLTMLKYQQLSRPILIISKYIQKGEPSDGVKSPVHNILFKSLVCFNDPPLSNNGSDKHTTYEEQCADNKLLKSIELMVKCSPTSMTFFKINGEWHQEYRKMKDDEIPKEADPESVQRFNMTPPGRLDYNKNWMKFILKNFQLLSLNNHDDFIEIFEPSDFPNEKIIGGKVVFFHPRSDNLPTVDLVKNKIDSPSFVFIEDVEYFLHNYRIQEFFNFLKELIDKSTILMFSTNSRLRFLQQELVDEFEETINYHCWDTIHRLEWMKNKNWHDDNKNNYPTPGSSKKDEIRGF